MSDATLVGATVALISPVIAAWIGSIAARGFTERGRLRRRIREDAELITAAHDPSARLALIELQRVGTSRLVALELVRGYPARVVGGAVTGLVGVLLLAFGVSTNNLLSIVLGSIYALGGTLLSARTAILTARYRERTRRAVLSGKPSGRLSIDIDYGVAKNVRRATATRPR